jgi:hypothetical protein
LKVSFDVWATCISNRTLYIISVDLNSWLFICW